MFLSTDTGAAAIAAPATTLCDDVVVPTRSTTGSDITILIISQKDAFNVRNAYRLRSEIREQVSVQRVYRPQYASSSSVPNVSRPLTACTQLFRSANTQHNPTADDDDDDLIAETQSIHTRPQFN